VVSGAGTRGRVCIVRQDHYLDLTVRREAEALAGAGFDVDVVCLPEPAASPAEVADGVTLHRLPLRRRRGGPVRYLLDYLGFFLAATVMVTRLHLRRPFVAVQVNTMPDLLVLSAVVPRLSGAKVIAFMKEPSPELGMVKYGSRRVVRALEWAEKRALRFADAVLTVTEDLKERYVARGADPRTISVVLNGPDARFLRGAGSGAVPDPRYFTAVCHGLVDERYGHDTMVRAVRLAQDRIPALRLRIAGRGEYAAELARLIEAEGVQDRVEFLGWLDVPDLVRLLEGADVGIVAQKASPYSHLVHTNKMFEYVLLGKPVVASRLASTARYFGDDALQYFEPGSAASLADALVALHADPERRRSLVEHAGKLYADYGWDAQKQIYLGVYAELLDGPPSR
jgi:glycosyltransferase involved in cell wall biosynthesis